MGAGVVSHAEGYERPQSLRCGGHAQVWRVEVVHWRGVGVLAVKLLLTDRAMKFIVSAMSSSEQCALQPLRTASGRPDSASEFSGEGSGLL